MSKQGLTSSDCARINGADSSGGDSTTASAVGALAAIAILAALAARGGAAAPVVPGGGFGQPTDYQWDWDAFNDQYGRLTWACRGVQSGQFADLWRCNSKIQSDNRWPGLQLR
jgi:hypothetical protein